MQNPEMPHIPGVGAVTDTLDFVKNLWSSMSVPGMSIPGLGAPALSVDDLDKKIADLKAVEAWLNVNVAMLRGSIQALEVQRGTLATLKSMGASLAEAMKQPGADEKSVLEASPFASAFFPKPAAAETAAKAEPEKTAAPAGATALMPDPTLWWNLLQEQFKQAVSSAMSPEAMKNASVMAQEAAARMSGAATATPDNQSKPAKDAPPAGGAPGKPRAPKAKAGKG
jgi:hypothetical protein